MLIKIVGPIIFTTYQMESILFLNEIGEEKKPRDVGAKQDSKHLSRFLLLCNVFGQYKEVGDCTSDLQT